MRVEDVMSTTLVTVEPGTPLDVAVERMLERDVGSVVVVDAGPVGIVTKSDVLRALLEDGRPLADHTVESVMSSPVRSIAPTASVQTASETLREADIDRLLVRNGLDVQGLLSVTDLAYHERALYREAVGARERGRGW